MALDTVTASTPTITGRAGSYTQDYIDSYSLSKAADVPIFGQKIYPKLFKNYGDGFLWLDFLRMKGSEFTVQGRRLTAFTQTFDERSLTLAHAVHTESAEHTIYFTIDSDDYDTDGGTYLRVRNVIYFPPEYFTVSGAVPHLPVAYVVTEATTTGTVDGISAGTGHNTVYTAQPLSNLTVIATEIPIGTKFVVGETAYAPGTGPIGGVITNELQYDFWTTILKEGCTIEGGANAERFVVAGMSRLWDRSLVDIERRLDRQMDYVIANGQLNTNSLVQTSAADGGSRAVLSTEGIMQKVSKYGMELPVDSAGVFEFDDFDAIRELLEAKGITNGNLTFGAATALYSEVENCPFAFIDDGYSPGSDLITNMNNFGIPFRVFKKNSYVVNLCEISSFTRPTGFGAIDSMKHQGLIIPDDRASVSVETGYGTRQKLTLPNFGLGFLEGRRRIMQPRAGVNEFGYPNTDGYDVTRMDMLTEFMVFMMDFDKMIHVHQATSSES